MAEAKAEFDQWAANRTLEQDRAFVESHLRAQISEEEVDEAEEARLARLLEPFVSADVELALAEGDTLSGSYSRAA